MASDLGLESLYDLVNRGAWTFDRMAELSRVRITFAVDTTLKIYFYDRRLLKYLSTDYKLYGILNGREVLLKEVHGNHQKLNRLEFEKGLYDSIRFVFEKNHGGQVAVQEIRAEA